ncbi:hypothetical protein BGX31_002679 [Mortierella sp. GBA43]|nr:hypothetical protein BGX31_002679 [Mortierella sp. GBA43]
MIWMYSPTGMPVPVMEFLSRPSIYSQSLDHLQQPLCPRFYKYDRQKLLLLEPNECMPLPSEHPEFSADICFSPFTCNEGLVRVRRRDRELCKKANLRYPISGNATHDAFHRQFSGPDSFHVVFSGSEKLSPPDWYHAGQCLYVFPFHISNPGKLTLDIVHLYDNYGAVAEQTDTWPVLKQQKVISNLPLEVCRGCPSRVAQPRFPMASEEAHESRVMKGRYQPYSSRGPITGTGKESELPLCSRDMAVQGVWLPAHPSDKQSWRRANYTWTPLGCTFGKPLDQTCLKRRKSALKVLFQGDTQLRVAIEHLLRRLNGTSEAQTFTATTTTRIEQARGPTTFTFVDDPLFSRTMESTDILVANMGQWATGTRFLDNLCPTAQYHDKIQELVDAFQQRARDLQDLDDEDLESTRQLLDGDYANDDEDKDEDEYDPEMVNGIQGSKEDLEMSEHWDDQTEEPENGHRVKGHSEGLSDRTKEHYPSNGFLRQSKHVLRTSVHPDVANDGTESSRGISNDQEAEARHRHATIARERTAGANDSRRSSRNTNRDAVNQERKPSPYGGPSANRSGGIRKYNDMGKRSRTTSRRTRRSFSNQSHDHDIQESPMKMAWVGVLAYPETQPTDSLSRHDWRTIYRLRYWNQIAEDVMLLHKVPFMDFFSMRVISVHELVDRMTNCHTMDYMN